MDVALFPVDSVSQRGASNDGFSKFDVTMSVDQYLTVLREVGSDKAEKVLQFFREQQEFTRSCISAQCGSLRVASSVASASSKSASYVSGSSGATGGLVGGRIAAINRMKSWRRKNIPDGLCYTKCLTLESLVHEAERLGEWPQLGALLRSQASSWQSLAELERFRILGDRERIHVRAGGSEGFSLLASARRMIGSHKYPVGSFGALLAVSKVASGPYLDVGPRTLVGGMEGVSSVTDFDACTADGEVKDGVEGFAYLATVLPAYRRSVAIELGAFPRLDRFLARTIDCRVAPEVFDDFPVVVSADDCIFSRTRVGAVKLGHVANDRSPLFIRFGELILKGSFADAAYPEDYREQVDALWSWAAKLDPQRRSRQTYNYRLAMQITLDATSADREIDRRWTLCVPDVLDKLLKDYPEFV